MESRRVSARIFQRRAETLKRRTPKPRRAIKKTTKLAKSPTQYVPYPQYIEVPSLQNLDFADERIVRRMLVAFALGLMYPAERRTIEMLVPTIRWRTMNDHLVALWAWRRIHKSRVPPPGTIYDGLDIAQFVLSTHNVGVGSV